MLTREAENGASTPILLARSRYASVRSLERYARPGPEAVAHHVAATGPARRRRLPGIAATMGAALRHWSSTHTANAPAYFLGVLPVCSYLINRQSQQFRCTRISPC
jgi:hypothetical protein